jgi:hypothetical protein
MALPRKATTGTYDSVLVNVYDLATKKIVFTGGQLDAADFMGVQRGYMSYCLKNKARVKKKYTVRIAKQ